MGMVQLHDQFNAEGFQILAFPCNQFGSQEPNSNAVIEAFAGTKGVAYGSAADRCGDAQCVDRNGRDAAHGDRNAVCTGGVNGCPFPMFAKSTVNAPMCANDASTGCTADSSECCTFNNQVYQYLRSELPGAIPWNFAKVRDPTRNGRNARTAASARVSVCVSLFLSHLPVGGAVRWSFCIWTYCALSLCLAVLCLQFLVDQNGNVVKRWRSTTEPPEMLPFIQAALAGRPMPPDDGGGH